MTQISHTHIQHTREYLCELNVIANVCVPKHIFHALCLKFDGLLQNLNLKYKLLREYV